MTDRDYSRFLAAPPDGEDLPAYDAEDPEQLVLPGLPAGFLAYQMNWRPV